MNKTITYEALVSLAKDAINLKGEEFAYEQPADSDSCLYVHVGDEDQPAWGCIVGHMLGDLGYSHEEIKKYETKSATDVFRQLGYVIDHKSQTFLSFLQGGQDDGRAWGTALMEAEVVTANF